MSLIKANAVQIGQSPTATQNFTLAVPSSPDGTIKLARGNAGATTQDVLSVDASGNVSFAGTTALGNISNSTAIATGSTTDRSLANRFADVVNVKDFGAKGDGVADDTAAIQAAINSIPNGGTLYFNKGTYLISSTIIIPFSNIILQGSGSDFPHNGVLSQGQYALTILKWSGLLGGTMVKIYSPTGPSNPKQFGCGIKRIYFNSNSTAGIGLNLESQNGCFFESLLFVGFSSASVKISCANAALGADPRDPQRNHFVNVFCDQTGVTGSGFLLEGDPTNLGLTIANVSMNSFDSCDILHNNGNAFVLKNSDNNLFIGCRTVKVPTGTGNSIIFDGSNIGAAYVARSNVFFRYSVGQGGAIIGRGTSSFTFPSYDNCVFLADKDNSTPDPTIEAGSSIHYSTQTNLQYNVEAYSTSSRQITLSDNISTNKYILAIAPDANPLLQNLRFIRDTGTLTIPLQISGTGSTVTEIIFPGVDNSYTCGQSGNRWSAVWAVNGTIQVSDEREKTEITPSVLGLDFIKSLNPVSYKWKVGGNKVVETNEQGEVTKIESIKGERVHYGLLAQEVKAALPEGVDFGGWVLTEKENTDSPQALRYDQFIAPLIKAVKELSEENEFLKQRMELLEVA